MQRFFIRNESDTVRLAEDGTLTAAHTCTPQYFDDEHSAYFHPLCTDGMVVDACPYTETLPGVGYGFATPEPTYDAVSADVYCRVAPEVHAILSGS